ncbi:MAG: aldo/keto reductase [Anaeromyxobacter sp.]
MADLGAPRYADMTYRTVRPERAEAARALARPLAQLRRHHPARRRSAQLSATAFDLGITHFDLANNYGPPYGSAESNFGRLLRDDLPAHRDEFIDLHQGRLGHVARPLRPGRRLAQVRAGQPRPEPARGIGVDYVDIFYSHRFDAGTPLEETMGALATAVQQGKALYVGLSSYSAGKTREAAALLRQWKVPCLIHQPSYNLFNRWIEGGLLDALEAEGMGCIAFTALAQGLLTGKYLGGVPKDARVNRPGGGSLLPSHLSEANLARARALDGLAKARGQSLAQLALAWVLRDRRVTSTLIGASSAAQIRENVGALARLDFTAEELAAIDVHAVEGGVNLWEKPSTDQAV